MNENTKDFVKDGLTNDEITVTVSKIIMRAKEDEIMKLNEFDRYTKLNEEFNFFSERYPMLFQSAINDEPFPWNNLSYMLEMRRKIIDNKLSSENASKIVGQEWYDKFATNMPKNKKQKN